MPTPASRRRALRCTRPHRDLRAMVAAGTFREDLWYRISVFSVRIPPLRDRLQDVPLLAAHFAHRAGVRITGVPLAPKPAEVEALLRYRWPGNVRELAAVIERAAILGGGRRLEVAAALGDGIRPTAAAAPTTFALPADGIDTGGAFPSLDDAVRDHIARALTLTSGRIEGKGGAADLLGLNPHTLRGKMRKLSLDWTTFRAPRRSIAQLRTSRI